MTWREEGANVAKWYPGTFLRLPDVQSDGARRSSDLDDRGAALTDPVISLGSTYSNDSGNALATNASYTRSRIRA
jgi:hypothetical protein